MGKVANPAPLGLFGFGLTTILLNFENAGISNPTLLNLVLAHGIFYGGLAQFCAGMWEFKTGNSFGATAFTSYGAFWISLAAFIWAHEGNLFKGAQQIDMTLYFATWGVLTALLGVITFRISRALQVVFWSLTVLFALLAIGEWSLFVHRVAGWVGLFCGGSAIYAGYAALLNETWGGNFLPLGPCTPATEASNNESEKLAETSA